MLVAGCIVVAIAAVVTGRVTGTAAYAWAGCGVAVAGLLLQGSPLLRQAWDDLFGEEAPAPDTLTESPSPDIVLVIPGRARFHRPGCPAVRSRAVVSVDEMSTEAAEQAGLTPCARCAA